MGRQIVLLGAFRDRVSHTFFPLWPQIWCKSGMGEKRSWRSRSVGANWTSKKANKEVGGLDKASQGIFRIISRVGKVRDRESFAQLAGTAEEEEG